MRARIFLLFFFWSISVFSYVDKQNGSVSFAFTDIGNKLKITRTYNSNSLYSGIFGHGWGSKWETYVRTNLDGSATVHEHGAGAQVVFHPKSGKVNVAQAVDKIMAEMKKKSGSNMSAQASNNLKKKLTDNEYFRNQEANRLGLNGEIKDGTKLYTTKFGYQVLEKTSSGYKRTFNDGTFQLFNKIGLMTREVEKGGSTVDLAYNGNKITKISNDQGEQLFFDWYKGNSAKVEHVYEVKNMKTEYKYAENGDLEYSKDVSGNVHNYKYTHHNMTEYRQVKPIKKGEKAGSNDKVVSVSYDPRTGLVEKYTNEFGETTSFKYDKNPNNPEMHYWTTVSIENPRLKSSTKNRFEYLWGIDKKTAVKFLKKKITEIQGFGSTTKRATTMNKHGNPIEIRQNDLVTNFEYYDDSGLLKKKTSQRKSGKKMVTYASVYVQYDKKWKKISEIQRMENGRKNWTKYTYSSRTGDLLNAVDSGGDKVSLQWNRKGYLTKIGLINNVNGKELKKFFSLTFNAKGKPKTITESNGRKKIGTVSIDYADSGEHKAVIDKSKDQKLSQSILSGFGELLDIVGDAQLSFSF